MPWSQDLAPLTAAEQKRLDELEVTSVAPGFLQIIQNFPHAFNRHPAAAIAIGRTMFETDRLPVEWVKACNRMDYIWVPSEFNRQTFAAAGVVEEKLVVIPGCLDAEPFLKEAEPNPRKCDVDPFTFLTVFDWTLHKGWDVLLRAFIEEFAGHDDVVLAFKVWSTMGYDAAGIMAQASEFCRTELNHELEKDARIRFIFERLPGDELRQLYRRSECFVLPSRGEGWGRPYMEAMACGLPVIGTNWSGNTAFMTEDNSFLINCEIVAVPERGWREIPTYRGHRWAEPDLDHLRRQMRRVYNDPTAAESIAARGRSDVLEHFTRERVGHLMRTEIERITGQVSCTGDGLPTEAKTESPIWTPDTAPSLLILPPSYQAGVDTSLSARPLTDSVAVCWEGAQFAWHSLGYVNRELCLRLLQREDLELSLSPVEPAWFTSGEDHRFPQLQERFYAPLSRPADVHVRHFFPPRFNPPESGRFVLVQPWEYGYLPEQWIEPIQEHVDEVWCYSNYVRDVYRNSGIPESKLRVLPLGVETIVFHPQATPYVFTVEPGLAQCTRLNAENDVSGEGIGERFVFLFVGGSLHRKGIDILLDAYLKAFSTLDDVCLVIKDTGTQTVYRLDNARDRILNLIGQENHPPIIYLEDDISAHQLAGVYTTSSCLVQPYRGEGFCLPALEAMACGLPVIVPEGGPTDDFVDETVGWRVPAAHKPMESNRIGEWQCVQHPWQFEIRVNDLARTMREIYHNREEAKKRGLAGAVRARDHWTWDQSAALITQRLHELGRKPRRAATTASQVQSTQNNADLNAESDIKERPAPTISLCMIVRNEERVLSDCLASIKPWVDEIIVVDTGSTDGTVEIAENHGARVYHFPWCDDFSAARNESLKHATGDWVLWMDADDTIPADCGRRLHELAFMAEESVTGFIMQVHIPPAPGEHGFTIVDHVKLFRNRPELRFEGRIHEQILEPIYRCGGRVERSDLYVVHSGYDYSPEGQARKRERDMTLLEKDLRDRPDHPFVLFNIGMTAYHLKDFDKGIPVLERCLALSQPRESTVRKVYAMLAGSYLDIGNMVKAKEMLERGLELFPHDPELLFRAGIIYREAGDLTAAEAAYLQLLTNREVGHIDSLDVSMTGYKAHHNLALIYMDMGRLADAEQQWHAALAQNPAFEPSLLGLRELCVRQQRVEDMRAIENRILELGFVGA